MTPVKPLDTEDINLNIAIFFKSSFLLRRAFWTITKELIKKESGVDILPDTLTKLLSRATINDSNRWNFPINEKNMEKD